MKRFLGWLFWAPVAIVLIYIAVANRHWVTFSLDPIASDDPLFSVELPLFTLLFAAMLLGLVIGGIASWLNQGKWRRAARQGLNEAAHWRKEATRPAPGDATTPPARPEAPETHRLSAPEPR